MILLLLFLGPCTKLARRGVPNLRRGHLPLALAVVFLPLLSINTVLVILVWNVSRLHRRLGARRLSFWGCVVFGAVLMCLGL
jgi:hypothetical protein